MCEVRCLGCVCELCSTVDAEAESCEGDGAEYLEDGAWDGHLGWLVSKVSVSTWALC